MQAARLNLVAPVPTPRSAAATPEAASPRSAALTRAWALKAACYQCWSSEPHQTVQTAAELRALSAQALSTCTDPREAREIEALADWTDAIACLTQGRMAQAARHLDAASARFEGLGQRLHAAQAQIPKIMALTQLGHFDDALACAEAAQRVLVSLGDVASAGKISLNLGGLYLGRGEYLESAGHSRAAAVLFARAGQHEHSIMADINHSNALASLGQFDDATGLVVRARLRAEAHGFASLQALAEEGEAQILMDRGRHREAIACLTRAAQHYADLAMAGRGLYIEKMLGDTYLELGLLPEALDQFAKLLDRQDRAEELGIERPWALLQRGRVLARMGRRDEAAAAYALAGEAFASQEQSAGQAALTLARAELALQGGDATLAERLAHQAQRACAASGSVGAQWRARLVGAQALLAAGAHARARQAFSEVLASARPLGLSSVSVDALAGRAAAALAAGESHAARQDFEAAAAEFEWLSRTLADAELRNSYLATVRQPLEGLLQLALADHARAPGASSATEVLQRLERLRARSLVACLADVARADDASTAALREQLNGLHRRLQRESDQRAIATLAAKRQQVERALLEAARRARLGTRTGTSASAHPRELAHDQQPLDVPALRASLRPDEALLEYGLLDDELFAVLISATDITVHRRVAAWSDVVGALGALDFQMAALQHGADTLERHLPTLRARTDRRLHELHALIWSPLAAFVRPYRRLLIVPGAALACVPFAALRDDTHYLVERHALAVAPSATVAARGLVSPPLPRLAVALGDSARLPHARAEAQLLAGLFEQGLALVDDEATLAALTRPEVRRADVLHLACHAEFRSDNPMFSALHLGDDVLSVEAVERLRLGPGFVVLSACETARQVQRGSGDDAVGLVQAFLRGGTRRVLASLWPVQDSITSTFMATFYSALARGEAPCEALRQAQRHLMRAHPHPFHWAAFGLHGGW